MNIVRKMLTSRGAQADAPTNNLTGEGRVTIGCEERSARDGRREGDESGIRNQPSARPDQLSVASRTWSIKLTRSDGRWYPYERRGSCVNIF